MQKLFASNKIVSSLALTAAISAVLSPSAHATITSSGNIAFQNSYWSSQLHVGANYGSPGDGGLEIDASPLDNGYTSYYTSALFIGEDGFSGTVRVAGDGASGSAQLIIWPLPAPQLSVGTSGTGLLEITNGGVVKSEGNVYLGSQKLGASPGVATTNIDGSGSILRAQQTGQMYGEDEPSRDGVGGGDIYVGHHGQSNSTVNITNGGVMEALSKPLGALSNGSVLIGSHAGSGSVATVNVVGAGSVMRASSQIAVGSPYVNTAATLNISAGGRVEVGNDLPSHQMTISTFNGTAAIKVTDAGSTLSAGQIAIGEQGLSVIGFTVNGTAATTANWGAAEIGSQVQDENGNLLYDHNGVAVMWVDYYGSAAPSTYSDELGHGYCCFKTAGSLLVENGGKVISQSISLSFNDALPNYSGQNAVLTVRNGGVVESDVQVFKGGELNGNGTIIGNVLVNGGVVAPGNSPGTLTIEGNLELSSGVLEVEISGSGAGEFDVVHVLGDLTAASGFDVKLKLLNNFTPQPGHEFEFLNIDGLANFDFSQVDLVVDGGVPAGLNLDFTSGKMSLVSTTPVPVPSAVWLFGTGLIGLLRLKRCSSVG